MSLLLLLGWCRYPTDDLADHALRHTHQTAAASLAFTSLLLLWVKSLEVAVNSHSNFASVDMSHAFLVHMRHLLLDKVRPPCLSMNCHTWHTEYLELDLAIVTERYRDLLEIIDVPSIANNVSESEDFLTRLLCL